MMMDHNSIEISSISISYPRLSHKRNILAKTSLASQIHSVDQSQPTVPGNHKFLNQNSLHWLLQEQISAERLALAQQVHGNEVQYVSKPGVYQNIDGFYTDRPEVYLTIRTADCAAVFISIPELPAVGIAHVGWRGARANIVGNLIRQMTKQWSVDPASFRIAISPHIKNCCYSVGEEFKDYFQSQYLLHRNGKLYLDLEKVIADQLIEVNIKEENFTISPDCTSCSSLPLYSYRAQQKTSNRLISIISIKND